MTSQCDFAQVVHPLHSLSWHYPVAVSFHSLSMAMSAASTPTSSPCQLDWWHEHVSGLSHTPSLFSANGTPAAVIIQERHRDPDCP